MILSKRSLVIVAFSAVGLAGWSGPEPPQSDDARAPATIESEIVPGDPAAEAGEPRSQLVLLTDGRIITGIVSEEEGKILVTQPVGVMRFAERKIERVFNSLLEVHAYKSNQVPEIDIDEQLKLAQWCVANDLSEQAKGHLSNALKLDPKNPRAKAMTQSITMTETRLANRQRDEEVRRTAAEVVDPSPMNRPAPLDSAVVRGARVGLGVSDLPVVFDLPPNAAVRRADEFRRYVHPVLQTYCAKCHDDRHDGSFQLLDFQRKANRTVEALRANLDSTLKLVDRENPGRSELLSSALRPHGRGTNPRPIFQGSNDRAYQILAAWAQNLRAQAGPESPEDGLEPTEGTEGFAVDRSRISRSAVEVAPMSGGPPIGQPMEATVQNFPAARYTPGKGWTNDAGPGATDAPLPFAISGVKPNLPPPAVDPRVAAAAAAARAPVPPMPRTTIPPPNTIPQPQPQPLAEGDDGDDLPPISEEPAAKKPATPLKLDPEILQRALQLKNGNR